MTEDDAIERACQRLILQFASANDDARWDEAAELFTDDGLFARPSAPDDHVRGRDVILAAFQSRPLRLTRHIVTNILVTVDSPATASAHSLIQLYAGGDDGRARPPLIGEFHDRIVLTPQGWRFSERRGRLVFQP